MSESRAEFERFNTMAMNLVPRPWRIKAGVNPVPTPLPAHYAQFVYPRELNATVAAAIDRIKRELAA